MHNAGWLAETGEWFGHLFFDFPLLRLLDLSDGDLLNKSQSRDVCHVERIRRMIELHG